MRNKILSLVIQEEMKTATGKQVIIDYKGITIETDGEEI